MRRCPALISALILIGGALSAQNREKPLSLAYDVDFQMNFDNREYDYSQGEFAPSETLFGARIAPYVGMDYRKDSLEHRLMLGCSLKKDFGAAGNGWDVFETFSFYYTMKLRAPTLQFRLDAGIFPAYFCTGNYHPAMLSLKYKWQTHYIEGLRLSIRNARGQHELLCHWQGMFSKERREQFTIYGAGNVDIVPWLDFGYDFALQHYAASQTVQGVVDNWMFNPYFSLDFTVWAPQLQVLRLDLGVLAAYQCDRIVSSKPDIPVGFDGVFEIRKWDAGIRNRFYCGTPMLCYYDSYGGELYHGEPFYRSNLYDCLDVFYEPRLCEFVDLKLDFSFHFNHGFSGWQQMIGVRFNLDRLLKSLNKAK